MCEWVAEQEQIVMVELKEQEAVDNHDRAHDKWTGHINEEHKESVLMTQSILRAETEKKTRILIAFFFFLSRRGHRDRLILSGLCGGKPL